MGVKSEFFLAANGSCARKNHRLAGANRSLRNQSIARAAAPDAPSRMPSVEESELEAALAEDSGPGPTETISHTVQRNSASL